MRANEFLPEEGKASRTLCQSGKPDSQLGASQLASCKSQGLRARDGEKSHLIGHGGSKVRITVGGKRIKGKKYGGPLPDYGTRKGQLEEANSKDTIKRVQQILKDLGYNLGPTGVDGIVGPYTQSAIDAYMSKKGPEGQEAPTKVKPKIDTPSTSTTSSSKPINAKMGSPYGPRRDGFHYGADFPAPTGTPVYAPDDGVVWSADLAGSAGLMVAINSGNTQHKLMHLSAVKVKPGEKVSKGQLVGLSGNTGLSTGPHLHWSKIVAGSPVNPMSNIG